MARRDYSHLKALQVHEDYEDCPPRCPYCHIEELDQQVEALSKAGKAVIRNFKATNPGWKVGGVFWQLEQALATTQQGGEE